MAAPSQRCATTACLRALLWRLPAYRLLSTTPSRHAPGEHLLRSLPQTHTQGWDAGAAGPALGRRYASCTDVAAAIIIIIIISALRREVKSIDPWKEVHVCSGCDPRECTFLPCACLALVAPHMRRGRPMRRGGDARGYMPRWPSVPQELRMGKDVVADACRIYSSPITSAVCALGGPAWHAGLGHAALSVTPETT